MFASIGIFKAASAKASYATKLQSLTAKNIANSDTPGYKAVGMEAFNKAGFQGNAGIVQKTTLIGHQVRNDRGLEGGFRVIETGGEASRNGNTVSLEEEILNSALLKHEHDIALSAYRSGLTLLRAAIGRKG